MNHVSNMAKRQVNCVAECLPVEVNVESPKTVSSVSSRFLGWR